MKGGWVYFMSNRRNGVLYVGVTSSLSHRVWQHREGPDRGLHEALRDGSCAYHTKSSEVLR